MSFEFSGVILLKICSVTSAKFPAHDANFAKTVVPLATTLYNIGMVFPERKIELLANYVIFC